MNKLAVLLGLTLLSACGPREAQSPLQRRAVGPTATAGWVKVPLDSAAQRERESLWLGDAEGRAVPFQWAPDGPLDPRALTPAGVLLGQDSEGRPTAEFSLKVPDRGGVREQLSLQFQCRSTAPWACQAKVFRRREGGAFLALDLDPAPVLYDFGTSGRRLSLTLPWDAQSYRVTLVPTAGTPPVLQGLTVQASTRLVEERDTGELDPAVAVTGTGQWRLTLPAPERVVGLRLLLEPPAAPVAPVLSRDGERLPVQGLVWNLPALGSVSDRLAAGPLRAPALDLELPDGAGLQDVKILVRNEVLLFPAEAGRTYYLHSGGRVKAAPGALAILPGSGRELLQEAPLALATPEPDPQGLPDLVTLANRARLWLPWAVGAAVVLLAYAAFRLFNPR